MKTFKCDICGAIVPNHYELRELYDPIKPEGISDLCKGCLSEVVRAKLIVDEALEAVKSSWIKKIILKIKSDKKA